MRDRGRSTERWTRVGFEGVVGKGAEARFQDRGGYERIEVGVDSAMGWGLLYATMF